MASFLVFVFLILLALLKTDKSDSFNQLEHGKHQRLPSKDALNLLSLPRFWRNLFVIGTCVYGVYDQQFPIFSHHNLRPYLGGNEMYGYLNSLQVFLEAGGMFIAPFLVNRIGAKMVYY